ncbi:tyrosine-protein phosphatase [Actinophytocola glycyrrhizae]|uniref:Tyrosine-protein phosphatase n=1 Tax=Actinophytocola glycyrrhizae TaxID=2044873 RepID=A0ABV9S394_9PSEU
MPRPLLAASVANLRDLGGLPAGQGRVVRPGRLLRSSALVRTSDSALDELTGLLGPATYVDLRTDREVDRDGGVPRLVARGWRWHRLPLRDDDVPRTAALPRYAGAAAGVAAALGDGPVVVACSLGKDRTGMVVALLLYWLGVPTGLVADDFAASNAHLATGRHLLPDRWRHTTSAEINPVTAADCAAALALAPPRPAAVAAVTPALLAPSPRPVESGARVSPGWS